MTEPLGKIGEKSISITAQHTQEQLHRAYICAIAGRAGVLLTETILDYGVDGTFRQVSFVGKKRLPTNFSLDYQLKATKNWSRSDNHISYDLEADTYNKLVDREIRTKPILLILFCMPPDPKDWLTCNAENLILRNCCYWHILEGEKTNNVRTKTIKIPETQLLTPDVISVLLTRVKDGEI